MFLRPSNIEEQIINQLKNGPKKNIDLVAYIINKRAGTKQGVYKVLRKLNTEEIITTYKKESSLSSVWLKKMSDFFALAQFYYKQPLTASSFLSLAPGQKNSFTFKTLTELDIFSTHIFYLLRQVTDKDKPIFAFNYHQWFYYGRQENDEFLTNEIKKQKQPLLLMLGDNNELDLAVKKIYNQNNSQCCILEKQLFPNNYYFNILDDFLIEFYLDKKIAILLDNFFEKHKKFDNKANEELMSIIYLKGNNKMIISKNIKKIEKLKKPFKKYFVY